MDDEWCEHAIHQIKFIYIYIRTATCVVYWLFVLLIYFFFFDSLAACLQCVINKWTRYLRRFKQLNIVARVDNDAAVYNNTQCACLCLCLCVLCVCTVQTHLIPVEGKRFYMRCIRSHIVGLYICLSVIRIATAMWSHFSYSVRIIGQFTRSVHLSPWFFHSQLAYDWNGVRPDIMCTCVQ